MRKIIVLAVLLALVALLVGVQPPRGLLETAGSSIPNAGWLLAALTGLLAVGGGWYAGRRRLRRQRDVRRVRERAVRWCLERPPLIDRYPLTERAGPEDRGDVLA
jgi:hypothetical protein